MYNRNTWLRENTEPSVTLAVYTVYSNEMNLRCTYFCHLRILNKVSEHTSDLKIRKHCTSINLDFFFFLEPSNQTFLWRLSLFVLWSCSSAAGGFHRDGKKLCVCCRHTNQHCPDWPLIRRKLSTFSGWAVPGTCTLVPQAHSMMYLLTVRPGSL